MKTIDEILGRDDYKRLTKQLRERVESIAFDIRVKLEELDETDRLFIVKGERKCDNVEVACRSVFADGAKRVYLAMDCSTEEDEDYGFTSWKSLEDVNNSHYYYGDFNAFVKGASHNSALRFLNVAKQIVEKIAEIEETKVQTVSKALEDTKDI